MFDRLRPGADSRVGLDQLSEHAEPALLPTLLFQPQPSGIALAVTNAEAFEKCAAIEFGSMFQLSDDALHICVGVAAERLGRRRVEIMEIDPDMLHRLPCQNIALGPHWNDWHGMAH